VDDDCDGQIDNGCVASPDTCAAPLEVALNAQRTAVIEGSFGGLKSDFDVSCGGQGTPDAVYVLDLGADAVDVTIETDATSAPLVIAAGPSCDATGFALGCAQPLQTGRTRLVLHNYQPQSSGSQLFLLIDAQNKQETGNYRISVEVQQPAVDGCLPTAFDFSECGTLVGFLSSSQGQLAGSCSGLLGRLAREAVMRMVGQQDGSLKISASSQDFAPTLYALKGCTGGGAGTEYGCQAAGFGESKVSLVLDLGSHEAMVVVDGGSSPGQSYTLVCEP
jgi:hypothetical protein